jgi:hypothetical protein
MQTDVAVVILNRSAFIAATRVVQSFEPIAVHAENANAQPGASAINKSVGSIDRHGWSRHLETECRSLPHVWVELAPEIKIRTATGETGQ